MRDYLSIAGDSRRWREFEHRDGDIVISTPSKSGTTWTQMLVGLLVFDGPDFPSPMSVISPWLEFELTPATEIFDQLAAQQHRRFIKTHVPLDGLPLDDRVTYVVVGRDPRDVFLSMAPHMANLDPDAHSKALLDAVPQAEVERRLAAHASPADFAESLTLPAGNCHVNTHVAHVLHHLSTGWQRREERNVVLVHYADLQRDLVTEMG
ncbi:sulfotransferase domain-containing protein, partial [Nocardioides sp.]|uniref:sulfotransferase domain-containing protein n=1 Tax=Nocardioides sp. TaxID=35761 RepID=UPI00356886D3